MSKICKIFTNCNYFEGKTVDLKKYDASLEGLITSWVERFPSTNVDDLLEELWKKDAAHF